VIERRAFLAMVSGSLLAAPLAAEAQPVPGRVYRIGLLEGPFPPIREARFLMGGALPSLGYVEGRNAIVERVARTNEELAAVASELARSGMDVIVALGLPVIRAAKDATKTVPIVMLAEGDPVRAGLVSSLGRPGRKRHWTDLA
jgi:putative tryptophan/tyrosine transport system substrate-binding protein